MHLRITNNSAKALDDYAYYRRNRYLIARGDQTANSLSGCRGLCVGGLADQVWEAWDRGKIDNSVVTGHVGRELLRCKLLAPRGAVAQLGERRVRNAKVGSSILLGSTI